MKNRILALILAIAMTLGCIPVYAEDVPSDVVLTSEGEVEIVPEDEALTEIKADAEAETDAEPQPQAYAQEDIEIETETDAEPETEAESETKPEAEALANDAAEAATEDGAEEPAVTEAEPDAETGADALGEAETETGSETEPEADAAAAEDAEPQAEAEIPDQTEAGSETEAETESEIETGSEIEAEIETETESEIEAEIETETESEIEAETETETDSESEAEIESETESEIEAEIETETDSESEAETEREFSPAEALEYLLGLENDGIRTYLTSLSEEDNLALSEFIDEDSARLLAEKMGIDTTEEIIIPARNYTRAGKLMPPVQVRRPLMKAFGGAGDDDNGLLTSKTVTPDGNGGYTVTLEAYTTGTSVTSTTSVPTDIVLLLDESSQMTEWMYEYNTVYSLNTSRTYYVRSGWGYIPVRYCSDHFLSANRGWYTGFHIPLTAIHFGVQCYPKTGAADSDTGHIQFYSRTVTSQTRSEALISAAKTFAQSVYNDAETNDVDHRISVIGFGNNNSAHTYVGLSADIRSNYSTVTGAIEGIRTSGDCYVEDGLTAAQSVFSGASSTAATTRNRVVIVFTTGTPGNGSWSNSYWSGIDTVADSADPAILAARTLKRGTGAGGYGATVYTIGLFDGADPEQEISDQNNDTTLSNKFMHYLSSNYPEASSMSSGGSGSNQGYYLSASDIASLNNIFTSISQQIQTPTIDLGAETAIKDTVTPYFSMPSGASDVRVYTAAAKADYQNNGFNARTAASGITPVINGNTVTVSGFDYAANFVSETDKGGGDYGKKFIVEFTVTPRAGFLGGNKVPTNTETSGIYDKAGGGGVMIEAFARPTADIAVPQFTITAEDKNVYVTSDLTKDQLYSGLTIDFGSSQDYGTWIAGLEDWQKAFVNITSSDVSKTDLRADDTYTASVTISPKYSGTYSAVSDFDDGSINVFVPVVTFEDSVIYLTQSADYEQDNAGGTEWLHGTVSSASVNMTGTAPAVSIDYDISEGAFTECTTVTPSVKVAGVQLGTASPAAFTVHVLAPKLTWKDTERYYGTTISLAGFAPYSTVWNCPDGRTASTNGSTAPVLSFEFDKNGTEMPSDDVQVNVTVKAAGSDITDNTEQIWSKCEEDPADAVGTAQFLIHPQFCSITIEKSVSGEWDPDQLFVFNISGTRSLSVTVKAGSSVTIDRLPAGSYSVSEDTDWSWNYTCSAGVQSVSLGSSMAHKTMSFTNIAKDKPWYYDVAASIKNIFTRQ